MKRIVFCLLVSAFAAASLCAQNINQSVEVTNSFETRDLVFDKQGVNLVLPDSMSVFHSTFNYSVFSNPYKGSSKFNPYQVYFVPGESTLPSSRLYLEAGAGYYHAPLARLVYTPRLKKSSLTVFSSYDGYYGNYWLYDQGHETINHSGISYIKPLKKSTLALNLLYNLYDTDYQSIHSISHGTTLNLGLSSSPLGEEFFAYKANIAYNFAYDPLGSEVSDNSLQANVHVAPKSESQVKFALDYTLGYNDLRYYTGKIGYFTKAKPYFYYSNKSLSARAGAVVSYFDKFMLSPDANVTLSVFKNRFVLDCGITGGPRPLTHTGIKTTNPFFNRAVIPHGMPLYSKDDIIMHAKMSTCLMSRLQLAATAKYFGAKKSVVYSLENGLPILVGQKKSLMTLGAEATFMLRDFEARGHFDYNICNLDGSACFTEPRITAGASAEYNYISRLFVSAYADFRTRRICLDYTSSSFLDLGLKAKYKFNAPVYAYLQCSNLLNQKVEIIPTVARKGVCATAGICVEIR